MQRRKLKIGFLIDPPEKLNIESDSSFKLIAEGINRGHETHYIQDKDLFIQNGQALGYSYSPNFEGKTINLEKRQKINLSELDVLMVRKDPPFDMDYIYMTYILELIEDKVFCINKPSGIRKVNEKLYAQNFAELTPHTLISKSMEDIKKFLLDHPQGIVLKPLDLKGGSGVLKVQSDDLNKNELIKISTQHGNTYVVAQEYLPGIKTHGDKRITILNGEPINAILRVPASDDFKGNLCAGATAQKTEITETELKICSKLKDFLINNGLYLVGLDLIDEKITEINVTSPIIGFNLYPENQVKIFDFIEEKM